MDIDPQAVEVTKLSLLLKVLEGESEASITRQLALIQARALPDLDNNIKCGNSLIGPDFYDEQDLALFTEEEHYRINVFDWREAFPRVFEGENPGFDAVIGNPPYIRIQTLKEFAPTEAEHYKRAYRAAGKGNYDIYVVFAERGLELLNRNGRLGYILPHKFFNAKYGQPVREMISSGKHLSGVVHFGDEQVFTGATTYTALMFLDKTPREEFRFEKVDDLTEWRATGESTEGTVPAASATAGDWNFVVGAGAALFEKLRRMPLKLGNLAHIFVGTQTSADDVFVLDNCSKEGDYLVGKSKSLGREVKVEYACTKPFLRGKQIRRYEPPRTAARLICPYEISENSSRLISEAEMTHKFPLALSYLEANKAQLEGRERGKFAGDNWHAFGYPKSMTLFEKPKIIAPDYDDSASYTFDSESHFYKTGYGVLLEDESLSPLYILGLICSPLLFQYLVSVGTSLRGGYVRFWTQYIEQLPIRAIDFSDAEDTARHERMVGLVGRMLELHERLSEARISREKTIILHQIEATDRQIDRLVYELYELSEEEIAVVEEAATR